MKKVMAYIFSIIFFMTGFAFLFSLNVRAYIDPSVMTYTIQAVAGIVIAIGAAIGIYYRKMKKKVSDKFGIDENRNKEVESDDIEIMTKTDDDE